MSRPLRSAALCLLAGLAATARADLEDLTRRLQFAAADGSPWASLSVTGDAVLYDVEQPPDGLLLTDHDVFIAPRITLTGDAGVGEHLFLHLRASVDRGFDPVYQEDGDARVDELYAQIRFSGPGRVEARAGRFPTAFGAWVERHLPWDNPLIGAPLAYDDLLTITDGAAPPDRAGFLARREQSENKTAWMPIVWGPSYASGLSVSATLGSVELIAEVKNAGLASRPADWNPWQRHFDAGPTLTARARWQPTAEWTLGVSISDGAYLREAAADTLGAGQRVEDFAQTTVGVDLAFEHRDLQLWSELMSSRFEVPHAGDVSVLAGFVEARYKLAPRFWVAGRWNQSWFDSLDGVNWDYDVRRFDLGLGYRHSTHVQTKVEYRRFSQNGPQLQGNDVLAAQLVAWF